MDIIRSFQKAFNKMTENNWEKIYVLVDIHDTILKACYREPERCEFIGDAKRALQMLSEDSKVCLILWSSSYENILDNYLEVFKENGISFSYVNTNPEVQSDDLGCFVKKPYFNILIDDKAGFDPETDWTSVLGMYIKEN